MARDYKDEYKKFQSSPKARRERSSRNKARRKKGLRVGDPRVVHHRDGNPMNNSRKNLTIMSRSVNAGLH